MTTSPEVSVLVPTHDSTWTLENSVKSALKQTSSNLEVLIVGDGVIEETRHVVHGLIKLDDRVRFLDLPKAPNRGEANRDLGVKNCLAENIFYLADDDLFLQNHVENLLPLLSDRVLVQSLNGYINKDGFLGLYPSDLSDPNCVKWHLTDPPRNAVSITGTAHKKTTYLQLSSGWEVPPDGVWSDLHLWRKFFNLQNFRGATHSEMTTIQFPSPYRRDVSKARFREIYDSWLQISRANDYRRMMAIRVEKALLNDAVNLNMHTINLHHEIAYLRAERDAVTAERDAVTAERDAVTAERDAVTAERDQILASNSWKITEPLRRTGSIFRVSK
jgi:glycosyltransferase involved in cell wall biosynthesis